MAIKKAKDKAPEIIVGSKWIFQGNSRFTAKVMAYVDGYIMWRFPRCKAGATHWKEWMQKFQPVKGE